MFQGYTGAGTNHLGANLAFTKFLFITLRRDDEAARRCVRAVGSQIARGFFNDFEADIAREGQSHETIHFLVAAAGEQPPGAPPRPGYVAQVSGRYRPRLNEVEQELRRRLGELGDVSSLDGALRTPRYTSPELYAHVNRAAVQRTSGRVMRNAIILPMSKTAEWWEKDPLDRHSYFYPHVDPSTGACAKGHARAAEAGISTIVRRLYHNPNGYQRPGEYDFVTYFECADEHLPVFERICGALRDVQQNPEWRYVREGPEWRGRRVVRW